MNMDALIDGLVEPGYVFQDQFISPELARALYQEVLDQRDAHGLTAAGIGRGQDFHKNGDIRRDFTQWLDGSSAAQQAYLGQMEELRVALNRALYLGLQEYECHFALYEAGAFYKKHRDAFKGQANRIVTTVLYLNPEWDAQWGGQLSIYDEEDEARLIAQTQPLAGRLACFMSERFPHEVATTTRDRVSIAGWFRVQTGLT
jgi:SM-20-related protein